MALGVAMSLLILTAMLKNVVENKTATSQDMLVGLFEFPVDVVIFATGLFVGILLTASTSEPSPETIVLAVVGGIGVLVISIFLWKTGKRRYEKMDDQVGGLFLFFANALIALIALILMLDLSGRIA